MTLLDIDVRWVLERVEEKYELRLPRKVVTVDWPRFDFVML